MKQWLTIQATLASHWRRHPIQTVVFLLGLALATALWSGVQALNEQARTSYDRAAGLFDGAALPYLTAAAGGNLPDSLFGDLRREGWPVSPVLEGTLTVDGQQYRILGIDPVSLPAEASAAQAVSTSDFLLADFLKPPGIMLTAPEGPKQWPDDTVGMPELHPHTAIPAGTLITDIGVAQQLLDQPDRLTRLLVPVDFARSRPLPASLRSRLVWEQSQSSGELNRLTDSFHLNLTALGLLAFSVGLMIVHSATGLTFHQRTGLLRTLRACGVSQRQLSAALIIEVVIAALLAGLAGLLLGRQVASLLLPDVAASLRGLYNAPVSATLSLSPVWWMSGLAMSMLGAGTATGAHLWQAARAPVLARQENLAAIHARGLRLQSAIGAVMMAGGAMTLYLANSLLLAFCALAALLLGSALILPAILGRLLQAGLPLARGPVSQWFWAEARQQMSGLSLALMALLLALCANIGVGGMVEGFRLTFTDWLDQRLAAEIYLIAENQEQADQMAHWAERQDDIDAVLPFLEADARFGDWPLEIVGLQRHPTYERFWPMRQSRPGAWERFAAGTGALISEQMANHHGLSVGQTIQLDLGSEPWTLNIEGIYADYGNPIPEIRVAVNMLEQRYRGAMQRGYHVRTDEENAEALVARARTALNLSPRAAIDQASLKQFSSQLFERTFLVTGAINTLTLGVAGIALFTNLLTLTQSRLPRLAPPWAMGVGRRRLVLLEWLRTLWLAALTVILAIPLGLMLCWALVARINVEAFGWRLPMYLFPEQWVILGVLALGVTVLATALPAWRLSRVPAGQWVRVFAAEE